METAQGNRQRNLKGLRERDLYRRVVLTSPTASPVGRADSGVRAAEHQRFVPLVGTEDHGAFWLVITPTDGRPTCTRAKMPAATRSAFAKIVRLVLTASELGIAAPSVTYMPG